MEAEQHRAVASRTVLALAVATALTALTQDNGPKSAATKTAFSIFKRDRGALNILRLEAKSYIVKDGEIMEVLHST